MLWVFLRLQLVLGVLLLPMSLGAGEGKGNGPRKRAPTDPCVRESLEELTGAVDKLVDDQSIEKDVAKMDIVFNRARTQRDVTAAAKAIEIPKPGARPPAGTDKSHHAETIGKKDVINLGQTEKRKRADTDVRGTAIYREPIIKMPAVIQPKPGVDIKNKQLSYRERIRMATPKKESFVARRAEPEVKAPAPAAKPDPVLARELELDSATDVFINNLFKESFAQSSKRELTKLMWELDPLNLWALDSARALDPLTRIKPLTRAERLLASTRLGKLIDKIEAVPEVAIKNKEILRKAKAKRDILRSFRESEINGVPVSKVPAPKEYWQSTATRESHPELYRYVAPTPGVRVDHGFRSEKIPGSPGNINYYGTGFGGKRISKESLNSRSPNGKPWFETKPFKDGEFPLPSDFEVNRVKIAKPAPGATKENVTDPVLAMLLEPGESSTLLFVGGERNVYITHPPVPASVPKTAEAQLQWARDNAYRIIKIGRPPTTQAEFDFTLIRMKREKLVRHIQTVYNDVSATQGRAVFDPDALTPGPLAYMDVVIQNLLKHRSEEAVKKDLVRYRASTCDAPCQAKIEADFAAEGRDTPIREEINQAIQLELFHTMHEGAFELMAANDLLIAGNWTKVANYHADAKALMDEYAKGVTDSRLKEINEALLEKGFPPAPDLKLEIIADKERFPEWAAAYDDPHFVVPHNVEDSNPDNSRYVVIDVHGGANTANGYNFDH